MWMWKFLDSSTSGVWIHAPIIDLHAELAALPSDHPIGSVILKLFQRLHISQPPNIEINISSTIPVASGLGSGAAVSVALFRALSSYLSHPLPNEQINEPRIRDRKVPSRHAFGN
jgi:mevalonate kinase